MKPKATARLLRRRFRGRPGGRGAPTRSALAGLRDLRDYLVEHEVGSVEKCLAEGFDEVVLLALNRGTLAKVRAVQARVGEKDRERLHFMSPEEFLPSSTYMADPSRK